MRWSSRLGPTLDESPWSAHVRAVQNRGQVRFDLTITNPTRVGLGPDAAQSRAILAALSDPRSLSYDPHPQGMLSARDAVCAHYARAHDVTVSPERVWLAASTSELYAQLFMLHCDPGDEVITLSPSYPLFDALARLVGASIAQRPLASDGHGWFIDTRALSRAITDRTRAIVCVSPNNPTGSRLRSRELAALQALCRERQLALIVDEVFAEYTLDSSDEALVRSTVGADACLTWTLGGLSKSAALPQMKLGWAVLSGPDALVEQARARFEHVADAFLSASAPVQCAADTMLEIARAQRERITERTQANLACARALLRHDTGASALSCENVASAARHRSSSWSSRTCRSP